MIFLMGNKADSIADINQSNFYKNYFLEYTAFNKIAFICKWYDDLIIYDND